MQKQLAFAAALLLAPMSATHSNKSEVPQSEAPTYTADGSLVTPKDYREWIFLTSGVDMSYASATAPDHHMFNNVFVNPSSYRAFLATGTWPDKTTMILENRGSDSPVSINKRGHTQSPEVMGMEIHVKDRGKWLFYDASDGKAADKLLPPPASCYTCHEDHAAVDTTFVQFYPTLLPVAVSKKTLSPAYLKEIEVPAK